MRPNNDLKGNSSIALVLSGNGTWCAPAICLAGSYIVAYNASENDYNTIEQGAFDSTYTKEDSKKYKK